MVIFFSEGSQFEIIWNNFIWISVMNFSRVVLDNFILCDELISAKHVHYSVICSCMTIIFLHTFLVTANWFDFFTCF
jgi:hypothetical protein